MSKLKSFFKVLGLVILVALLLEVLAYGVQSIRLKSEGYRFHGGSEIPPYPTKVSMFSKHYMQNKRNTFFNNYKGMQYKTNPILVFGDAFANSSVLTLDESLTAKLSNYTKKPVLNLAEAGWGVPHMYYMLKNEPLLDEMRNVDTILFVYNDDMKNRLSSFSFYPHHDFLYLKYKLDDGILLEHIPQVLVAYNSYFVRAIERFFGNLYSGSKNPNKQQNLYLLMKALFVQSKYVAKFKYPKFKNFVILRYTTKDRALTTLKARYYDVNAQLEYNFWEQLKDEGFVVIDTPELSEKFDYGSYEYFCPDYSPNESAWNEIVPKMVKRFK